MVKLVMPLCLLLFFSCTSDPSTDPDEIVDADSLFLIPYPNHIETKEGFFTLDDRVYVRYDDELSMEGAYLTKLIDSSSTFKVKANLMSKIPMPEIRLELTDMFPEHLQHGEAYQLSITPEEIIIRGLTRTGVMRGIQTLRQVFVPAFHQQEKRSAWYLPCLVIEDKPAFEHRGLLLDVCRHFFELETLKNYIDLMAFYKMNILHLHLTEDQGWRFPSDKYPKLNEISSWRIEADSSRYGGYYTREELKELVNYASERHIVIIPEIELPGHSQAALAAYPELSCSGGPIEVANDWGVFKEIYCAGNDSTFLFLENILLEVMEIFPSEYIHIGGDEAPKTRWESCSRCQKRIKNEELHNEHELQSWFIRRIENFLNGHGRKLIGWDEILEGGLSENATVQSWRGLDGGITAARDSHYVIMSPTSHCYLDYDLSAIDLQKIYEFNPIPSDLEPAYHQYILGAECNMWTEHVPDRKKLDQMVFPRLIGLAERLWSNPTDGSFDDFYHRLQRHYPILDGFNVRYGLESIAANIELGFEKDGIMIHLITKLPDLELEYAFVSDSTDTPLYTKYSHPFKLDQSGTLLIQAYKNKLPYGEPVSQVFSSHKALNAIVSYNCEFNSWYIGSAEKNMTDGKLGSLNFRDGNWQGFWGNDVEVVVDLGAIDTITTCQMNFYQYANSWIIAPKKAQVMISSDSLKWQNWYSYSRSNADYSSEKYIVSVSSKDKAKPVQARYILVRIPNSGKMPAHHEAAGADSWIFMDEIIIN